MSAIGQRLRSYYVLGGRLLELLSGSSYYHLSQPLGAHFVPGKLAGYYNDLSGKVNWQGALDADGIPLNVNPAGERLYFATTIAQKALAHWETWLSGNSQEQLDQFLNICRWLRAHQDDQGGWSVPFLQKPPFTVPYSSMAQAESASVLVRAYTVTSDEAYLDAARRSLAFMLRPVSGGGMTRYEGTDVIIEEFPANPPNTVYNGWVFSLFGLYDYLLAREDAAFRQALDSTIATLVATLPQIDAGYWSYYDTRRNLSSPFYQALYVVQMQALELAFPNDAPAFAALRRRLEQQSAARLNRMRAIAGKAWQKVIRPPAFVIR